ncbi:hypothetical protein L931_02710 [Helicobacter pylori PZ5024]|uniref:Uncharacterized protein n=1 Tax=Helicobacter pylori PZ5024 TaxID=1337391 RepID=T2T1S5_HELPX|nr:hypothetical protein L931_02710 [Helicobacter pylori PZ5024]
MRFLDFCLLCSLYFKNSCSLCSCSLCNFASFLALAYFRGLKFLGSFVNSFKFSVLFNQSS